MRFKCFFLLTGLALIVGPAAGLSRSGDADNGGPGAPDLGARWKQLTGDVAVWRRADLKDPYQRFLFDLVAYRLQSANGEITREQFLQMPPRSAAKHAGAAPAKGAGDAPGSRAARPDSAPEASPPAGRPGGEGGDDLGARAESVFRGMDIDGDGLFSYDEMEDALKAERDKWDTNKDGFIDLAEFTEYYKARMGQFRAAARGQERPKVRGGAPPKGIPQGNREPGTPAPFAPELPPGLPDWFRQYDTDGDGQIGLYEWKAAGQPIAKFLEMDANGDGFLTPDEVLWATGVGTPPSKEPTQQPRAQHMNTAPAPGEGMMLRRAALLQALGRDEAVQGIKFEIHHETQQRPANK